MKINKTLDTKYLFLVGISLAGLTVFLWMPLDVLNLSSQIAPVDLVEEPQLRADSKVINFPNSDENDKESLIIKSDQAHYSGTDGSDAYFSVTNTSKKNESAILLFYFPGQFIPNRNDPAGTQPATVVLLEQWEEDKWQKREFFAKNIKINNEMLGKAINKRKPIPEDFEVKAGTQIEVLAGQTVYFKSKISFRSTDSGEFWIEALGKNGGYGLLDPTYSGTHYGSQASSDGIANWYQSGSNVWANRKKITINKDKVSGGANLTDFPVLLSFTDINIKTTAFGGKAASGSGEFVFTASDGTSTRSYEIESYSSSSGQFIGWVKIPTLSATVDTVIYMYYGGSSSGSSSQNRTGTWETGFKGVWHMKEFITAVDQIVSDSTSNANNGTTVSVWTNVDNVAGKIGNSLVFNAVHYISIGTQNLTGDFAISGWVNLNGVGGGADVIVGQTGQDTNFFDNKYRLYNGADRVVATTANTAGVWNYYVITRSGTALILYRNGVSNATGSVSGTFTVSNIGSGNGGITTGRLDEVRLSTVNRTAGWILTEYNNQNNSSMFFALGPLESRSPTNPGLKILGGVKFR